MWYNKKHRNTHTNEDLISRIGYDWIKKNIAIFTETEWILNVIIKHIVNKSYTSFTGLFWVPFRFFKCAFLWEHKNEAGLSQQMLFV